jgi:hypothetical protein
VDTTLDQVNPTQYDALMLPGGALNADSLRANPLATAFIQSMATAGTPMAVNCHARWELIDASLVRGRTLTSYHTIKTDLRNAGAKWVDQEVVVDGTMVTSRQPSDLPTFDRKMRRLLARSRQVGPGQASAEHSVSPTCSLRDDDRRRSLGVWRDHTEQDTEDGPRETARYQPGRGSRSGIRRARREQHGVAHRTRSRRARH